MAKAPSTLAGNIGEPMTLDELRIELGHLERGQMKVVSYDLYSKLFPIAEPNQFPPTDSYSFAEASGCRIENRPSQQELWIIKGR